MKDIEIAKHFTQLTPISGETDEIRDQSQKPLKKEDQTAAGIDKRSTKK